MFLPPFMLKQLYRAGSLQNQDGGFRFEMTNPLMPGTINRVVRVAVDGTDQPLEGVTFSLGDSCKPAAEVSDENPVNFPRGAAVVIQVPGEPLPAGSHRLVVQVKTDEFGDLKVDVQDSI